MFDLIALCLITEALVALFFTAAPLQGIRTWLIWHMPCLRSEEQGHLFECKYCVSVWFAFGVVLMYTFLDYPATRLLGLMIIVGRLSNFIHILYSVIRDMQINLRLTRR